MPYINWSDSLSVHVDSMDDQHRHLIRLLNQLYDTSNGESSPEEIRHVLDGLLVYVRTHFWREERLMQTHRFPGLEAHHREHEALVHRTEEISTRFEAGQITVGPEILYFLKNWLSNHIQVSDKAYGRHIEEQKRKVA